jgi:hypothetical protein
MPLNSDPTRDPAARPRPSFSRRVLRGVTAAALLAVACLAAVGTIERRDPRFLVDVRDWMFTRRVSDAQTIYVNPADLARFGFLYSDARARTALRIELRAAPAFAKGIDDADTTPDVIMKAKTLVRMMSAGGANGSCGLDGPLVPRLAAMKAGEGCCSDHTKGFLSLAAAVGLTAREIHTSRHGVVEIYDPGRHRWLMIDPMYAVMPRSADRRIYLTGEEWAAAMRRHEPLAYDFFGTSPAQPADDRDRRFRATYWDTSQFGSLVFTNGNNTAAVDALDQTLHWLPKPARQLVEHWRGVRPGYLSITVPAGAGQPE